MHANQVEYSSAYFSRQLALFRESKPEVYSYLHSVLLEYEKYAVKSTSAIESKTRILIKSSVDDL